MGEEGRRKPVRPAPVRGRRRVAPRSVPASKEAPRREAARREAPRGEAPVSRRTRRRFSFSAGRVLAESLRIYGQNFLPFSLLAMVVYLPLFVVVALSGEWLLLEMGTVLPWLILGLAFVLPYVLQGAVAYGVFQEMRGARAPFLACVQKGVARLLPVLGVALFMSLILGALRVLPMAALGGLGVGITLILALAGWVVMMVLMLSWFVAVPVAVVENARSPLAAVARSGRLTTGARGSLFLVLIVMGALSWFVNFVLERATMGASTPTEFRTGLLLQLAGTALLGAWQAIAAAVAYHDLRRVKEGVGISEIVQVFS